MVADENALYVGTANPNNLMYDANHPERTGGWELLELTRENNDVMY